jgi:hypothetical protein
MISIKEWNKLCRECGKELGASIAEINTKWIVKNHTFNCNLTVCAQSKVYPNQIFDLAISRLPVGSFPGPRTQIEPTKFQKFYYNIKCKLMNFF